MSKKYPEKLIELNNENYSIPEWLLKVTSYLKNKGYRKYNQSLQKEDYAYWKTFLNLQVGILFYDWRKYDVERIGIMFKCHITDIDDRVDLTVSKDISLEEFEIIAQKFYDNMNNFI